MEGMKCSLGEMNKNNLSTSQYDRVKGYQPWIRIKTQMGISTGEDKKKTQNQTPLCICACPLKTPSSFAAKKQVRKHSLP